MKAEDRYLKFVRWSDEDGLYLGYCPDLFPWGGVCHAPTEGEAYTLLAELVRAEVEDLTRAGQPLPEPATRPMREAMLT
jgi:predicted RNase H-like HicB family nuclease